MPNAARWRPLLPIVFLTARDEEVDVISGLRLGADDYLTKDISQSQLLARITGLLRRVLALRNPENREQVLRRGDLELNTERLTTAWKHQAVPTDLHRILDAVLDGEEPGTHKKSGTTDGISPGRPG